MGIRTDHLGYVLITGASTGIGRACAMRLAGRGYGVIAGVRRREDAESLQQEANRDAVPLFETAIIDVTREETIRACADRVAELVGSRGLRALVNNAGIGVGGPIEVIPLDDWRRQFEVNVFGQVAVTKAMLPLLRKHVAAAGAGAARIVMMSSIAGKLSQPTLGPYCASKHALEAIGDALRLELRAQGIQTSLVEPGAFRSEIWAKAKTMVNEIDTGHPEYPRYEALLKRVEEGAMKIGSKAPPASRVADVVRRCIEARRAPIRVLVGMDAKGGAFGRWLLPSRWMDYGLAKAFGI